MWAAIHPYIHTHTLFVITWDTFVPGSTLWCWINMRIWPCGISGPAQSHHPSIYPFLSFILQVQRLQWLTYYITQETLICSLSRVHVLLRGNSAHSHNIFVDRWFEMVGISISCRFVQHSCVTIVIYFYLGNNNCTIFLPMLTSFAIYVGWDANSTSSTNCYFTQKVCRKVYKHKMVNHKLIWPHQTKN